VRDACLGLAAVCPPTASLHTPRGSALSPDGRFAYVVAFSGDDEQHADAPPDDARGRRRIVSVLEWKHCPR